MIVVDTSVWVGFFRGASTAPIERLVSAIQEDEGVALTDVVFAELLQGVRDDGAARRLEQDLLAFDMLRLERLEDFRLAGALYRRCRASGVTIRRTLDCLIAAVCIRDGVPVLHDDSDFDLLARHTELEVVESR